MTLALTTQRCSLWPDATAVRSKIQIAKGTPTCISYIQIWGQLWIQEEKKKTENRKTGDNGKKIRQHFWKKLNAPFVCFLTYFIDWQNEPVFCVIFEGFFLSHSVKEIHITPNQAAESRAIIVQDINRSFAGPSVSYLGCQKGLILACGGGPVTQSLKTILPPPNRICPIPNVGLSVSLIYCRLVCPQHREHFPMQVFISKGILF